MKFDYEVKIEKLKEENKKLKVENKRLNKLVQALIDERDEDVEVGLGLKGY